MTTHAESNRRGPGAGISIDQHQAAVEQAYRLGLSARNEQLAALLEESEQWARGCDDAARLAESVMARAEKDGLTDRARQVNLRLRESVGARNAYTAFANRLRAVIEG